MVQTLKPRDIVTTNCNKQCTLWHEKLTLAAAEQLEVWIQEGYSLEQVMLKLGGVFGITVAQRNVYRHVSKHMTPVEHVIESGNMTDLQVIEEMIKVGARNLKADAKIRISPEMTIKAIELKYRLTQGNVFQSFLSELGNAMADEAGRGDDPSIQGEDEAAQAVEE